MTLIQQDLSGRRALGQWSHGTYIHFVFHSFSVQALPTNTSPQASILHEEQFGKAIYTPLSLTILGSDPILLSLCISHLGIFLQL